MSKGLTVLGLGAFAIVALALGHSADNANDAREVAQPEPVATSTRPGTVLHCAGSPEHKNVAKYGSNSGSDDYPFSSYNAARIFSDMFPGNCVVIRRGPDMPPGQLTQEAIDKVRSFGGADIGEP